MRFFQHGHCTGDICKRAKDIIEVCASQDSGQRLDHILAKLVDRMTDQSLNVESGCGTFCVRQYARISNDVHQPSGHGVNARAHPVFMHCNVSVRRIR